MLSRIGQVMLVAAAVAACACGLRAEEEKKPAEAKAKADELVLRIHDIRELTLKHCDWPGPEISLESWAGGGPLPVMSCPNPSLTPAVIQDMIIKRIQPESWLPGKGTSIEEHANQLVVVQAPVVHRRIEELLKDLRRDTKMPLSVQGLLVAVDAEAAAKVRARKARTFDPKEVEDLVKAAGKEGVLASVQVLCQNGQRNHAANVRQVSYAAGLQETDGVVTPVAAQVLMGSVLDVCPVLDTERRTADVEVRFSFAGDLNMKRVKARDAVVIAPEGRKPQVVEEKVPAPDGAPPEPGVDPLPVKRRVSPPAIWAGELSLPSASIWRPRNTVNVSLGKYVLAAVMNAPVAAGGNAGRTALLFIKVSSANGRDLTLPKEDLEQLDEPVQRIYDVRDLTALKTNFPGPAMGALPQMPGAETAGAQMISVEPDVVIIPPGNLQDFIKRVIEPAIWGGASGETIEEKTDTGQLIIWCKPSLHTRIREFIDKVRIEQKWQIAVRGLVVAGDDELADRIRARKGAGFSVEEAEALLKERGVRLLAEAELLAYQGQRVHALAGRQVSGVTGFSAAGEVGLPVVSTWLTGWAFDVRPLLSADRRSATVELKLTRVEDAAGKDGVPQFESQFVRGSPSMPLGSYVLAGSFRSAAEKGKAAENVFVLVKAELLGPGK